jgi:NDP-sugar pyrophosphorylase family protein
MNEKITKAMIMAAGVGSRLEPLTLSLPKPLVPVANRPVMDILLERLNQYGINDVIANTYYHAGQIIEHCRSNPFGINFNYITEESLSGTAGGLKKCQFFFNEGESFLVLSADGLSNADLAQGIRVHQRSGVVATIGIKKIPRHEIPNFGVVVTDENGFITGFQEKPAIEDAKSDFINTGIYIFNYKIFDFIPSDTFYDFAKNVFPRLLELGQINTFEISEYWSDIGTLEQYALSTQDVFAGLCKLNCGKIVRTPAGAYIAGNSVIPSSVSFTGNSTIGGNCEIGEDVKIENSIIWDNVKITPGVSITNSIIASDCVIEADLNHQILSSKQQIEKIPA